MGGEDEARDDLDVLQYFITELYNGWRDCLECQYNTYICSNHVGLVEPLLQYEAERRGEHVRDFQLDTDEEAEWMRDIGGES